MRNPKLDASPHPSQRLTHCIWSEGYIFTNTPESSTSGRTEITFENNVLDVSGGYCLKDILLMTRVSRLEIF